MGRSIQISRLDLTNVNHALRQIDQKVTAGSSSSEGKVIQSVGQKGEKGDKGDTGQPGSTTLAHIEAQNDTGTTIPAGAPVEFAGAIGNSGNFRIAPASVSSSKPAFYFVGLMSENVDDGGIGLITTRGKVQGIQTNGQNYGETWAAQDLIYVSETTGYLTNVAPEAPVPAIVVALVISAHASNGTLEVRPTFPTTLEMLSDVDGVAAINGSMLYYDFAKSVWDKSQKLTWDEFTATLSLTGVLKRDADREKVLLLNTSTNLTHTATYAEQRAQGITTTLWASPNSGDSIRVRNRSGGSCTINGGGNNIEGTATKTINNGEGFFLVFNGSEWTAGI